MVPRSRHHSVKLPVSEVLEDAVHREAKQIEQPRIPSERHLLEDHGCHRDQRAVHHGGEEQQLREPPVQPPEQQRRNGHDIPGNLDRRVPALRKSGSTGRHTARPRHSAGSTACADGGSATAASRAASGCAGARACRAAPAPRSSRPDRAGTRCGTSRRARGSAGASGR